MQSTRCFDRCRFLSCKRTLFGWALVLGILMSIGADVGAQTFRSSLYPRNWRPPNYTNHFEEERVLQDFSYAGYHSGLDPLPDRGGRRFNVVNFGADSSGGDDSTSEIQDAINACQAAGGGIVFFPAGRYRVSLQDGRNEVLRVSGNNVVLRGAGAGSTRIFNATPNMRESVVIRFRRSGALAPGRTADLTRDRLGPTRRLFIQNAGRFSVGESINILWDATPAWIREHGQQGFWGTGSGRTETGPGIMQRRITRVNGSRNYIEINSPIRYYLKTRDNARVQLVTGRINECGLEDISIGDRQTTTAGFATNDFRRASTGGYRCHSASLVEIQRGRDCWIRNVRSFSAGSNSSGCHMRSNGICLRRSFNITVINCRMERPQYGGAGGNGYMYEVATSCECLIQNCVANFSRHGFSILRLGASGNVFYRCRDLNSRRSTGLSGNVETNGDGADTHQYLSPSNLFDSCVFNNSRLKFEHRGNSSSQAALTGAHNTVWNFTANGTRFGTGIISDQGSYGYIIGTRGRNSGVRRSQTSTTRSLFPVDFAEGIGDGANLRPRSLYLDQRRRRGL